MYRTQHVGCLSLYTEAVAREGMVGLAACSGGSSSGHWVAPWGGREGRIGTNPISLAAPTSGRPILFDAATSAISEGKVRLSRDSGKSPARHLARRRGGKSERRSQHALRFSRGGHPPGGRGAGVQRFRFCDDRPGTEHGPHRGHRRTHGRGEQQFLDSRHRHCRVHLSGGFPQGARRVRRLRKISSPCRRVRAGSDAWRARLRNRGTPRCRGDSDRRRGMVADRSRRR